MRNLLAVCVLALVFPLYADSTLSSVTSSNSAWGANVGWINCYADKTNGAVIGDFICSGYIYAANLGWINLGNGAPANGVQYKNNSAADFGVNHDGMGNLRGYAYGANIGWVSFETNGAPTVNLKTGVLNGYAWGANVGWISLSNAFAVVKTDSFFHGVDSDGDGIPDPWELLRAGNLTTLSGGNHDADGDGVSDFREYLADTDPLNANDNLRITDYSMYFSGSSDIHTVTFTSRPSRLYRFNLTGDLNSSFGAISSLISPDAGTNTTTGIGIGGPSLQRYLRMEAVRPLSP